MKPKFYVIRRHVETLGGFRIYNLGMDGTWWIAAATPQAFKSLNAARKFWKDSEGRFDNPFATPFIQGPRGGKHNIKGKEL
jgi:hypothetical protein